MKRGVSEPLLDEAVLCLEMGWTYQELLEQPTRFLDILKIYLNTLEDIKQKENRRIEEELKGLGKKT